jgi:glutathione S-transferase
LIGLSRRLFGTSSVQKDRAFADKALTGRDYLTGGGFCVADAYLFTIVNWAVFLGMDFTSIPALAAFHKRVGARPAVVAAMAAEGLLK